LLLLEYLVFSQSRDCVVSAWDIERQCKLSSMVIDRAGFCKLAVLDSIEGIHTSIANCIYSSFSTCRTVRFHLQCKLCLCCSESVWQGELVSQALHVYMCLYGLYTVSRSIFMIVKVSN